jgi:hypothetical protein
MRFFRLQTSVLALSLLAIAAFVSYNSPVAGAQGIITGGITGTVTDGTGAVIPNATVKAVNEATGVTLQGITNGEGNFTIADVPIGAYTVTLSASGFSQQVVTHIPVATGNATPIKASLNLGEATQTVQVEGSASYLLNTESAQDETLISSEQLASLPVAGAFDNVTLMVPGVVQTHDNVDSYTNGVNYSANGQRGTSNNSEIDGQSNNDNSIGGPSFWLSNQDALQEIQVITTDMGAQYGRNMGAVVNYVTKSGTNTFHGSAFEYYLGSWGSSLLASQKDPQYGFCPPGSNAAYATANACSLITVPRFVLNLYGGTFGGPIIKNKLWFFGETFWAHEDQTSPLQTTDGALFPTPTGLSELATEFPNNPAAADLAAIGPYSIPQGNPAVNGAITEVPVTNGTSTALIPMSAVQRAAPESVRDQEELGRLDYQMTDKDRFYLRYNYQNNTYPIAWWQFSSPQLASGAYSDLFSITHEVGGDWTHTFTPNLIDQLRYAFQQSNLGNESGALPKCTFSNFSTCTSEVALGTGYATIGYPDTQPDGHVVRVNQVQDNAQWTKGRHSILFGGEYDFQNSPNFGLPNVAGTFNFQPGLSGIPLNYTAGSLSTLTTSGGCIDANTGDNDCENGISGMLQDIGLLSLAAGKTSIPYRENDFAFYFQDNWKVSQSLTVNLGLRYEYFGQAVNLLHNESVAQQTGSNPFWDTSLPLSATTFPHINPDHRNVEPRIGFAYAPSALPKLVVHGGFAINVDSAFYNIFLTAAHSAPLVNANTFVCDGNCLPANGLTYTTVQAADAALLPTGIDPRTEPQTNVPTNFRNPMAETYTLGIQYQVAPSAVAEVRYVGVHTFDQFQSLNTNPDLLDVQTYFPGYGAGLPVCTTPTATGYTRENCNYSEVDTVGNTAFDIYNALQTSLTIRNFHHWTGTASYTFSRGISNTSGIYSTGSGGNTNAFAQDPLNVDIGERGVDGNSYPNVAGIQTTYTEPWFSEQKGILGRLLGGYFLNSFYSYNGGQPFNPYQSYSVTSLPVLGSPIVTSEAASASPTLYNQVTSNFCDVGFTIEFSGNSPCRPILANRSAPLTSVGINVGSGTYENYVTGAAAPRSSFHWLWNNKAEAIAMGNPFPGVGRNTLRGKTWNDVDASIGKNFKIKERLTMQLTMSVFDVLNRAYYGTPDASVEDSWYYPYYGLPASFLRSTYGGGTSGAAPGDGAYFAGLGNRNIQISAHVNF